MSKAINTPSIMSSTEGNSGYATISTSPHTKIENRFTSCTGTNMAFKAISQIETQLHLSICAENVKRDKTHSASGH